MRFYGVAAMAIGGLTTGGLALGTSWPPLALYLAGVNAATLAVYGWDKRVAGTGGTRAPERLLHGLAFAGGTPAALAARIVFRHKTRKTGFRIWFWCILILQTAAAWMLLTGRG